MKTYKAVTLFLLFSSVTILGDFKKEAPAVVCVYLKEVGLGAGRYRNDFANEYIANSPYKELGTGSPLRNNIAFYAEGTKQSVRLLKLVLNINHRDEAEAAHKELAKSGSLLSTKALEVELPAVVVAAIEQGKPGEWSVGGTKVTLVRVNWPTGKGYELKLTFQ